jgi:hypothetical protein
VAAAKLDGSILTVKTAGIDPLAGLILSQGAVVEVVKESQEIGEDRLIDCVAGALPPAVAEKLKLAGVAW